MYQNRITNPARFSINLITIVVMILSMSFGGIQKAAALEPAPKFSVHPEEDAIGGWWGWPLGTPITFSVDDPLTLNDPDYTGATTVAEQNPNSFLVYIGEFIDIRPGFEVIVSDGVNTKSTIVTNLEITIMANPVTDTISGIAEPGSTVVSQACEVNGCKWDGTDVTRTVIVDAFGNWVADYSVIGGSGEPVFDILPGANIWHIQNDDDGDSTRIQRYVPNPRILTRANEDRIEGNDWTLGATVTIDIDDPLTGQNPDKTVQATVGTAPWNPNESWFEVYINDYDLKPGDFVIATEGTTQKQLTIENLLITDYDLDTEIVTGVADAGQLLYIQACEGNFCANRDETADQDGNWTANFAVPGEGVSEQDTADLRGGTWLDANINDGDGDMSRFGIGVPNSRFHVQMVENNIEGYDWMVGSPVTLTIDDPSNGAGVDFSDTQPVIPFNGNPMFGWVPFHDLGVIDLEAGMLITMQNGSITKSHTITNLIVTDLDLDADTVSGTGTPGANVSSQYCDDSGCLWRRRTTVQPDGSWLVDFSIAGPNPDEQLILDIVPGIIGAALQRDGDTDFTDYQWGVIEPSLIARLTHNQVDADSWPAGTLLTITVEDPLTGLSPDYSGNATSEFIDPQDPNAGTAITFHFNDNYTLKSGDEVTVTGGGFTRTTTVADIHVTNVDVDNDIVSGTAGPGITSVNVRVWGIPFEMKRDAPVINGIWSADFSIPSQDYGVYDIKPGDRGVARWFEEDGDFTTDYWEVPNPTFGVRANDDRVEGWQWTIDSTITIDIDDPLTGPNPDKTVYAIGGIAPWNPNEEWFEVNVYDYDIKVGDLVTVTDGSTTKQHTVVNLNFTQIDTDTEQVFGTADADQLVNIWTCWENDPCINRDETADQNGDWITNFAIPGEQSWEQDIADLRIGSWIDSSVNDDDGDVTMFGLTIEPPPPPQCQPGNTVTGTVYEHDGVTPITSAYIQIEDYNTGDILFVTNVDQNGQFACSLADGDYRIHALADNYSQEYFDEAVDTNAALVQVTTGTQLTNINFTLSRLPTMEHLTFNLDNALLQDLVIRQAISLGTNRQEILNEAFLPSGQFGLVSNSIVPPEHWASAPASELTLYPYDPAQANAILEAAGWINRDADVFRENAGGVELAFSFKTTPAQVRVVAAELFRQYMESIGIRITVEHIQPSALFDPGGVLDQGNFDIAEFAWGGSFDDAMYLGAYITDNLSVSGYSNPLFDAAMANAAAASTDAERLPYLYEAQAILTQDLPITPLFTRQNVAPVTTPTGNNVTVSPESYLDIHFDEVTDGGVTTVLPANINPDDLPLNFQLLGQVYDVGSNAQFTSAQLCFSYDDAGLTAAQESAIQLLHLENNAWANVTDNGYPDTVNNVVCGTVTSFSPFAVMIPQDATPPTITWVGDINDGDSFYFGFVPAEPTCTADDPSGVDGPCTVTGYESALGLHTLTATAMDNAGNVAIETRSYTVLKWTLNGFFQPVDMNGVYNLVKGGSTVPFKFEVFAGSTELTDIAYITGFTYIPVACDSNAPVDVIETTVTGSTSLRYDATSGQFIYNWKTPKTAGMCYRVTMTTIDGSTLAAYFRLK